MSALYAAFSAALSSQGYAEDVMLGLAHNHTLLADGENSSARGLLGSGISREEAVVKSISATLNRFHSWPGARKPPPSVKSGQFIVLHAQSLASLSQIQPEVGPLVLAPHYSPLPLCEGWHSPFSLAKCA